jgi:hypothetical protein
MGIFKYGLDGGQVGERKVETKQKKNNKQGCTAV